MKIPFDALEQRMDAMINSGMMVDVDRNAIHTFSMILGFNSGATTGGMVDVPNEFSPYFL